MFGRFVPSLRGLTWHPLAAVLACAVFVAGTIGSVRLARLSYLDELAEVRAEVASQMDHVRGNLSRELFTSLSLGNGLVELVSLRGGVNEEEFDALAAAVVRKSPNVRNVALAPGTVIRYVHPRIGNESALGVDYTGLPNQRAAVLRAINTDFRRA